MTAIDRRSMLLGAAVITVGLVVTPKAAESMPLAAAEALAKQTEGLVEEARVVVVGPRRRRRRRWVCWWRRGRRVCGWR
jgi:hypothetical protein